MSSTLLVNNRNVVRSMAATKTNQTSMSNENKIEKTRPVERAWYVLRAISGKEAKVKEILDAQIRNTDLGKSVFQVLIPTEKIMTVRNGKKVVKERNLYSGYVFVEAYLTGDVQYLLRNTTNVIDFLKGRGKDAQPEALRESEVMRMLGTADEINEMESSDLVEYLVGETVKVIDGAFSGFNGEIKEVQPDKKKLWVNVRIFGRNTPLELTYSQVERE